MCREREWAKTSYNFCWWCYCMFMLADLSKKITQPVRAHYIQSARKVEEKSWILQRSYIRSEYYLNWLYGLDIQGATTITAQKISFRIFSPPPYVSPPFRWVAAVGVVDGRNPELGQCDVNWQSAKDVKNRRIYRRIFDRIVIQDYITEYTEDNRDNPTDISEQTYKNRHNGIHNGIN